MNFAPYELPPEEQYRRPTSKQYYSQGPSNTSRSDSNNQTTRPESDIYQSNYHQGGRTVDPTAVKSFQSSYGNINSNNNYNNQRSSSIDDDQQNFNSNRAPNGSHSRRPDSNQIYLSAESYETRFGWRVDLLSGLSYCTPIVGIIILIFETKNDYVRIHGYQSILLAIPLVFLHLLFISSHFLQVLLFFIDLGTYGWLGYQAYCDAEMLNRNLLPFIGPIAERWTIEE
ncbi:hypothetical protein BY996DRAFT_4578223 [Phakopsora pachyrhizi]|uniref:Uncharacterized protein n=1 Tax=Phakopsora pachyrhizi TaxID=170000 RepID=A0AAV0BLQ5_PHAPC|nr:hypothetical protein BY996DRAFT_4578223 [Phakopsora pachyrhizi]CAH7686500.1 hypothetical protein PPACK8108_LOCUS21153 [Phakopsora pachyrhizi]